MSGVVLVVGDGLAEGFFMFWETLWALVLGFALSGAVQAFVSRREMQRTMGDHRAHTLVRVSLLGAASSSCSYAAAALSKSLLARGADFVAAMVFMFASTNLVVELGIVLWLLIGWQFTLAEYVGGAIMIALFGLVGPRLIPRRWVEAARHRLVREPHDPSRSVAHDGGQATASVGDVPDSTGRREPWRQRLRRPAGWADAASYAMADLGMLRRELLLGYLIAGMLSVAVPASAWEAVFFSGHGWLSTVENVIVGPFIAFVSFVCSIGNVPLAAALWQGGISFGGVIAFIFADLIAFPLVVIYRKYYGRALALRMFAVFWLVMSTAGLLVEVIFAATGLIPTERPTEIAPRGMAWSYTTILNIVFLVLFAGMVWLARNQARLGGGRGYARDPVCGMQVELEHAPARARHDGATYWFCSDGCRDRFLADAARYAGAAPEPTTSVSDLIDDTDRVARDPVCGMLVEPSNRSGRITFGGRDYWFCSPGCREAFRADPARHEQANRGAE